MPALLEVRALAGLALVQDAGRAHRSAGVPRSGAFDRRSHASAAALVGGGPDQAGIELVGRATLAPSVRCTLAVTGEATVAVGGAVAPGWTALDVPAGVEVTVATPRRAWIAVAGGVRVAPVLGSRSTCLLGPLGPPPLAAGDALPLVADPTAPTVGDVAIPAAARGPLRMVPGPHVALPAGTWTVVEASRIGIRLRPLRSPVAGATGTLPSLGVVPGTIQVLPAGDCMVLGPDSGTMGGYPVAGVVCTADLDRLAALMPGDGLDLAPVAVDLAPVPTPVEVVRLHQLPG